MVQAVLVLGMLAVFAVQFGQVSPTNFGGTDEWLYIDLASRGILGIPYAHRPLVLLWTLPAARLAPHDLWSYYATHAAWLVLAGWLTFLLARRLLPRSPLLWYLAGTTAAVWAPEDFLRLDSVLLSGYSGFTFGALAATLLFLESWFARRPWMLVLAGLVAVLTGRGFEGTIPLMAGAPLLLLWRERERSRRLTAWIAAWWGLLALLTAVVAAAFFSAWRPGSYQVSGLGLDPHPLRFLGRIAGQFGYHLLPLVQVSLEQLAHAPVLLSTLLFLGAFFLAWRLGRPDAPGPDSRRELLGVTALGLALAALGYSLLMLSPSILRAARTQFLSGPGIALALASLAGLAATAWPPRTRHAATALLGAWIVALGGGRTLALQREWDTVWNMYPRQHASLDGLTRAAPHVVPGTFVILLDEGGAWPESFGYRHALAYLYEGRARGQVFGAGDFLYPMALTTAGVLSTPWPVLGPAWGERSALYRHDEIVVARDGGGGDVAILEEWPASALGKLPEGATYAPAARVVRDEPLPASRAILRLPPRAGPAGEEP